MQIDAPSQSLGSRRRKLITLSRVLAWGYLLFLILLIGFLRTRGDRTDLATLLLFGPRWPWLLPLLGLVPLAFYTDRRLLIVLGVALWLGIFPLLGFCIGWQRLHPPKPHGMPIRIVALNIHHFEPGVPAYERYIAETQADIVGMEEVPTDFDRAPLVADGWHLAQQGEILLASRFPITSCYDLLDTAVLVATLQTPRGPIEVLIVHLGSPHYALRDAMEGKRRGKAELSTNISMRQHEAAILKRLAAEATKPLIIAGDFNLTTDSPDFANFSAMTDGFEANGLGLGWTYLNKWTEARIDHVLSDPSFDSTDFRIGPDVGSPHRPISAELYLTTGGQKS